jgi:hypothetical protein
MDEGSDVVAGADDEIDLLFVDVGFFAFEADLIAALKEFSIALGYGEMRVGRRVIERSGRDLCWDGKRASHSRASIGFSDLRVTLRAIRAHDSCGDQRKYRDFHCVIVTCLTLERSFWS